MTLKRQLDKLEAAAAARVPPEPEFSEPDIAIATAILERTYADPVRYAKRIEQLKRIEAEHRARGIW